MNELIVDNFAGGGGASTGIEIATGRPVDIAINHDPAAIAMHRVNHPHTRHFCENIWDVNPIEACQGKPVALAWFSPDCRHHSKCKAGKPREKSIRGLAWVAVKWAATVKPRVIILENVEEFQTWGPLLPDHTPDPAHKGRTFKLFIHALKRYGYEVQYRELRACDYGAPTSRKRFFLIARSDNQPIVWPNPTHGPLNSPDVLQGSLKPYRSASEILDFSIEGKSIFERNKTLCENSLRRIVRGLRKFVFECKKPFIIQVPRATTPSQTQQICTAFISKYFAGGYTGAGSSITQPLPTITTIDHNSLVVPYFSLLYGTSNAGSVLNPFPTITAGGQHIAEIEALLTQYQTELIDPENNDKIVNQVRINGQTYQITDIKMRMLTPRELFNAQGFPGDYIIDRDTDGNHYCKTAQIARCGNAVPPAFATALVKSNLPELCPDNQYRPQDLPPATAISHSQAA